MKRLVVPLILVLVVVTGAVGYFWWNENSMPVSNNKTTKDFLIVRGRGASQIGNNLYEEGFIRNPLAFKVYVQITGKADQLQAGEFRLSSDLSLAEIVEVLTKGPVELWVTVPEGLRREEVVGKFVENLEMGPQNSKVFRREFLDASQGMEGFLFPDTYLFPRDATAQSVVDTMREVFDRRTSELQEDMAKSTLSLDEIVILASIIERETKTDKERPIVAGILLNRLEIGMALQADATAQYAVASAKCKAQSIECEWWPTLTRDDLQISSPFNTYENVGLPPAPIANPGLSSLAAVINPVDTEYFYYLHEPSGQIHYAESLEEHNENIRRYLSR